jgi:hypothetical protein
MTHALFADALELLFLDDPEQLARSVPTSSTRTASTLQPRNSLSMAKLNMARSRLRPSIYVLTDRTWLGRRGGLGPTSLPLFQGSRRGGFEGVPWPFARILTSKIDSATRSSTRSGFP